MSKPPPWRIEIGAIVGTSAVVRNAGGPVLRIFLMCLAAITPSYALANPFPDVGPPPAWVKRVPVIVPAITSTQPARVMLLDQQVDLRKGAITRYTEAVVLIQTAAGLAAGNVLLEWRPDVDDISVNTLTVTRAGKTIDVLAKQKFTVIRRETNLDAATLDGRLTASLIIDGVEVGDVVTLGTTIVSRDPTMAGHVEAEMAQWNGAIDHAHARLHWAKGLPINLRTSPGLPAATTIIDATGTTIELSGDHLQPPVFPKGAPARYSIGRILEATDYKSWGDLGRLMTPLFASAAKIGSSSPLAAEVARIRAASSSPTARASAALDLVESKVRYVALQMGEGGYVPANADATWANRFGDCKAKTALLLALLHQLDIAAVPILVSSGAGDGLDQRLPMMRRFDHVLVRATIANRDYYLDGTRSGDKDISRLDVPNYHWGLPLLPGGERLARLTPQPRLAPDSEFALSIDAREGIFVPAKAHSDVTYTGDGALILKATLDALPDANRDLALREFFRNTYDFIEPSTVATSFDPATGIEKLSMDGTAQLKWDGNWSRVPASSLAWEADFARPSGPDRDAPFAVDFPSSIRATTTIRVPASVKLWPGEVGHDVDQTLAGVHYHREASLVDGTLRMVKSQVTVAPEVDAAAARAAQARLRRLNDEDVHLDDYTYVATDADLAALKKTTPDTAAAWYKRGRLFSERFRYKEAIADFDEAHRLDEKDAWTLANRAIAKFWTGQYDGAGADAAAAAVIDPANAVAARVRGLLAQHDGDYKGAVGAFTASLATDPGNVFSLRRRADSYLALRDYAAALADTDALLRISPGDVDVRLTRASILAAYGKHDAVLAEAKSLEQSTPRTSYALIVAARIYANERQRGRALDALQAALAIEPEAYIYVNRAEVRDPKDFAARRGDLDAALKLEPTMPEALSMRARLAFRQHDDRSAIADYTALLDSFPKDADPVIINKIRLARALAYKRSGDSAAAQKDFAAAALDQSPAMANQSCWTKVTNDLSLTSALDDCNRALKGMPKNAAALDSRGVVYLKLGRLDEALSDFNAALALQPRQASSLFARSIVWARKGDAPKASADRAAAIALSPDIVDEYASYGLVG